MRQLAATGLSLVVNGIIVAVLCLVTVGGCSSAPKEELIPMEFTVVVEENAADFLAEDPNDAVEAEPEPEPEPEPPKPEPEPELPPPPLLPDPDPIPAPVKEEPKQDDEAKKKAEEEKKKAEEAKKKAEEAKKKAEEEAKKKAAEKKKAEKKPIKIGKRVGPVTQGKKDPKKAATAKKLSEAEIARMLAAGAKPGNTNQVPSNEASRCAGMIYAAFREACDNYGLESSPTGKDPEIKATLGSGGTVKKIELQSSSGDRAFDNQVLQACRQVKRVSGLSESFIKEYSPVQLRIRVN